MNIEINLKNQNKKEMRKIFNKLYKDLNKYRKSEYNAFMVLKNRGVCLAV